MSRAKTVFEQSLWHNDPNWRLGMSVAEVQIRVHGIGEHADGSALGPASIDASGVRRMQTPERSVVLLGWSRASRRYLGPAWGLLIPFSMINAAGEMKPEDGSSAWRKRTFKVATLLVLGMLTMTATCWSVAIIEELTRWRTSSADGSHHWLIGTRF